MTKDRTRSPLGFRHALAGVAACWLASCGATAALGLDVQQRPNIIVILADDLGYADVAAQGAVRDVRTPHLDRLASEGVRCTAGYVTAPQCTPSRAGLLTGRYQQRFGLDTIPDGPLPLEETTVAERLQTAGYTCGMVGKWHLEPNPLCRRWAETHLPGAKPNRQGRLAIPPELAREYYPAAMGFDDYFCGSQRGYWANYPLDGAVGRHEGQSVRDERFRVDVQSGAAVSFIERNAEKPFFLYVGYFAPHVPLEATPELLARFPGEMPNRRRHALAMIAAIDDGVGRILAALAAREIDNRTLIVFTSDNGAPLKLTKEDLPLDHDGAVWDGSLNDPWVGEKGMLAEGGIRVPFLVRWPDGLPAGSVYEQPVSTLDIAATAVAIAGAEHANSLDGANLIPHLSGREAGSPHEALYWRFWNQAALRAGNWKYLALGDGREFLFDLTSDAHEHRNLIETQRPRANELRGQLARWTGELQPPGLPTKPLNGQEQAWYDHYFPTPK